MVNSLAVETAASHLRGGIVDGKTMLKRASFSTGGLKWAKPEVSVKGG